MSGRETLSCSKFWVTKTPRSYRSDPIAPSNTRSDFIASRNGVSRRVGATPYAIPSRRDAAPIIRDHGSSARFERGRELRLIADELLPRGLQGPQERDEVGLLPVAQVEREAQVVEVDDVAQAG